MKNRKPTLNQFLTDCAMPEERFYALYAALKLFYQVKKRQAEIVQSLTGEKAAIYLTGAEAYCMLEELKEHYPTAYGEAAIDYKRYFEADNDNAFDKCLDDLALLLTGRQKIAASS